MKNRDLITALQKLPLDAEVFISDGYEGNFYSGEYRVALFGDEIDIGIGGCQTDTEEDDKRQPDT